MDISIFDIFSVGIGPSSSHTVGPMRAAQAFVMRLYDEGRLTQVQRVYIELFGSLAYTGKGHRTDKAVALGLEGFLPDTIDPEYLESRSNMIAEQKRISLLSEHSISFNSEQDFLFNLTDTLPGHPNALRFSAFDRRGSVIHSHVYYSVGGGFIADEDQVNRPRNLDLGVPYKFDTAQQLIDLCTKNGLAIRDVMLANECVLIPEARVKERCLLIARIMRDAIERGCNTEGTLPGMLKLRRRAPQLMRKLQSRGVPLTHADINSLDWLNVYAIAVSEENAAGGRIVTAPTNGAAGIIPAVLHYYINYYPDVSDNDIIDFLLTASAIGILYKKGASISGAEVGCQGEIGVACSMAAAAFTSVLQGTLGQIENAAEIAMEHMLGLTCDPVGGLVQIPCIERNAVGAVEAVTAARLALLGDGSHHVSLNAIIATMKQTGNDMLVKYKETSQGGLAVNVISC